MKDDVVSRKKKLYCRITSIFFLFFDCGHKYEASHKFCRWGTDINIPRLGIGYKSKPTKDKPLRLPAAHLLQVTSRVLAVLLLGNSRNVNIFLSVFLAPKLHRSDYPTCNLIVEYHRKNIIPKPENICLYSIVYSN
jgi:hypothetical protein